MLIVSLICTPLSCFSSVIVFFITTTITLAIDCRVAIVIVIASYHCSIHVMADIVRRSAWIIRIAIVWVIVVVRIVSSLTHSY